MEVGAPAFLSMKGTGKDQFSQIQLMAKFNGLPQGIVEDLPLICNSSLLITLFRGANPFDSLF